MGNAITIDELEEAYSTAEVQKRFYETIDTPTTGMPTPEPFYYDAKTPETYEPFGMLPLDVWTIVISEYLSISELRVMGMDFFFAPSFAIHIFDFFSFSVQVNSHFVSLVIKTYERNRRKRPDIRTVTECKYKIELPYQPQVIDFQTHNKFFAFN